VTTAFATLAWLRSNARAAALPSSGPGPRPQGLPGV